PRGRTGPERCRQSESSTSAPVRGRGRSPRRRRSDRPGAGGRRPRRPCTRLPPRSPWSSQEGQVLVQLPVRGVPGVPLPLRPLCGQESVDERGRELLDQFLVTFQGVQRLTERRRYYHVCGGVLDAIEGLRGWALVVVLVPEPGRTENGCHRLMGVGGSVGEAVLE